jgi:hypothetical protein
MRWDVIELLERVTEIAEYRATRVWVEQVNVNKKSKLRIRCVVMQVNMTYFQGLSCGS